MYKPWTLLKPKPRFHVISKFARVESNKSTCHCPASWAVLYVSTPLNYTYNEVISIEVSFLFFTFFPPFTAFTPPSVSHLSRITKKGCSVDQGCRTPFWMLGQDFSLWFDSCRESGVLVKDWKTSIPLGGVSTKSRTLLSRLWKKGGKTVRKKREMKIGKGYKTEGKLEENTTWEVTEATSPLLSGLCSLNRPTLTQFNHIETGELQKRPRDQIVETFHITPLLITSLKISTNISPMQFEGGPVFTFFL